MCVQIKCLITLLILRSAQLSHLKLELIDLVVHPLHLTAVILAQGSHLRLELVDLFIFALLSLDEDHRVVEALFHQVLIVVLPHHLYFAAKLVIRALHQLEFTSLSVLLYVLSQGALAALVVTLDDFEEASFVVGGRVLADDDRLTTVVLAHDSSERAGCLVGVQLFPPEHCIAAFLKEAFALIWAGDWLHLALDVDVVLHLPSEDCLTTSVAALKFCVGACVSDVVVHLVQRHFLPAV